MHSSRLFCDSARATLKRYPVQSTDILPELWPIASQKQETPRQSNTVPEVSCLEIKYGVVSTKRRSYPGTDPEIQWLMPKSR